MAVVGSAEVLIRPTFTGLQQTVGRRMNGLVPIAGKTGGRMGNAMGQGIARSGAAKTIGTVGATAAVASGQVGGLRGGLSKVGGVARNAAGRIAGVGTALGAVAAGSSSGVKPVGRLGDNMRAGGGAARFMARQLAPLAAILTSGAFLMSGFKMAASMQRAEKTLSGLYGSTSEAKDMMTKLRDVAANRPIDYTAFADAAGQMAYMGYEGKEARQILGNVADSITAVGGSSEDMGRASDAMLNMVNSGKVYAAQLNQISATGVPIFSALAAHFDTNISNVREMVQAGKVGIDDVMGSIQKAEGSTFKQMKAAAEETAQSFSGQFSIAKDKVKVALGDAFRPFIDTMTPKIKTVGSSIVDVIKGIPAALDSPAVKGFGSGIKTVFDGLLAVLKPVGSAIAAAGRALGNLASKVDPRVWGLFGSVIGGVAAAFAAWRLTLLAVRGAILVATAVQWAWNAALSANPIGLIVLAIGALVAGVVYAGENFKTFRTVVKAVWHGIKVAALAVVNWFKNVAWPILKSVFTGIAAVAKWLYNTIWKPIWTGIKVAFLVVATAIGMYWKFILKPVFKAWAAIAKWIWRKILRPIFSWIGKKFHQMVLGFKIAYRRFVKPTFNAVANLARWLWKNVLKRVFTWIGNRFSDMARGFKIIWRKVLKPVFDGIASVAKWLYRKVIKPVFNKMETAVGGVGTAFSKAKDLIAKVWGKLKKIASKPIRFIVDTLYMQGIRPMWNKIASAVNLDDLRLPKVRIGKAAGGTIPGSSPSPTADNIPIMATAGEYMVRHRAVRRLERSHPGLLDHMNRTGTVPGFASGGLVKLGKWLQAKGARVSEHPAFGGVTAGGHMPGSQHYSGNAIDVNYGPGGENSVEKAFFDKWVPVIAKLWPGMNILWRKPGHFNHAHFDTSGGGGGGFDLSSLVKHIPGFGTLMKLKDRLASKIADSGLFGKALGKGSRTAVTGVVDKAKSLIPDILRSGAGWVKNMVGKIGGFVSDSVGNLKKGVAYGKGQAWAAAQGWFGEKRRAMNYIIGHESGWNPRAQNPVSSAHGLPQMINSTARAYGMGSGVWSQLDAFKRYVQDRYGGVIQAADYWKAHGHYAQGGQVAKYDNGGMLPPGISTVVNETGKPEPVFTQKQLDGLTTGSGTTVNVTISGSNTDSPQAIADAFNFEVRRLSRSGVL